MLQVFFLLNPLEVFFLGGNDGGAFNEMHLEVIEFLLTVGVCVDAKGVADDDAAEWLRVCCGRLASSHAVTVNLPILHAISAMCSEPSASIRLRHPPVCPQETPGRA